MIHAVLHFIRYYLRADTKYRIHSPSLFTFVNDVIETDYPFYCYEKIEGLRSHLLQNHNIIELEAPKSGSTSKRKISDIASDSLHRYDSCRLIHRIATHYKPKSILELGTNLGISTSYLSNVAPTTTIADNESAAEVASSIFDQQDLQVDLRVGQITDIIEALHKRHKFYDLILVYFNPDQEITINHFHKIISILNDGGTILYFGIYRSGSMTEAWKNIQVDKCVKRTIDLYDIGIVEVGFCETAEHKTVIKSALKPFQLGFFSGDA